MSNKVTHKCFIPNKCIKLVSSPLFAPLLVTLLFLLELAAEGVDSSFLAWESESPLLLLPVQNGRTVCSPPKRRLLPSLISAAQQKSQQWLGGWLGLDGNSTLFYLEARHLKGWTGLFSYALVVNNYCISTRVVYSSSREMLPCCKYRFNNFLVYWASFVSVCFTGWLVSQKDKAKLCSIFIHT